jgi:hypothetical protein
MGKVNRIVEHKVRWSVAMTDGVAFYHGEFAYPCVLFLTRAEAREYAKVLNARDKHSIWTARRVFVTVEECDD